MREKRNRKKWKEKIEENGKLMSLKITEGSKVEAEERRTEQNIRTNKTEEFVEPKTRRIRRIRDSRMNMKATWKKGNRYEWKIKAKRKGKERRRRGRREFKFRWNRYAEPVCVTLDRVDILMGTSPWWNFAKGFLSSTLDQDRGAASSPLFFVATVKGFPR